MQIVVLLLLVAGLALLVLGLITASTPLVLASAAASLLAGYAISRYRRRQVAKPAVLAPAVGVSKPAQAPRTSSAVTVAELAQAVAAERAAAGEPPLSLGRAPGEPAVAAGSATVAAEAAHAAPATALAAPATALAAPASAHAAPASAHAAPGPTGRPTGVADRPAESVDEGESVSQGESISQGEVGRGEQVGQGEQVGHHDADAFGELDPPVAETDPPLRSRGAEPVCVIDGRPRYHLAGCEFLRDRAAEPVPLRQAVEDGFTPCGLCDPDTGLAAG